MGLETKIKEAKEENVFPCLYSSENRETIIIVTRELGTKLEGVVLHPKNLFGQFSSTWSTSKYKKMNRGSELNIKFTQE